VLPCFVAGCVFYLCRPRIPWHPALAFIAALVLFVACKIPHAMSVASPIAGSYLVFTLAFLPARWLPRFGRFGDFSYGLYVYAFPLQQAVVATAGTKVGVPTLFVISYTLTLLVAITSWHLIESPCLSLKGIWKRREMPHDPPACA
jgi:peptidoglycan/LPS O-acetylase OafA/YrhL